MARPLRVEFPGAVYHVTNRGNAWQDIFLDDEDKGAFLTVLGSVVQQQGWLCHAFCLMDNHYHLLIETLDPNLSRGMRQLGGVYAQQFNRRHGRAGHLFQGRFKSIIVDKDNYLLELCRYVVLNPVRAGMVPGPSDWAWSSYRATGGESQPPGFLTTEWILSQFGSSKGRAQEHYRRFVLEGIGKTIWEDLRGGVILGGDSFVETIGNLLESASLREVPRHQRFSTRPSLDKLFATITDREERNEKLYEAHVRFGYTLTEIGNQVGLHYATISRIVQSERQRRENAKNKM